MGRRSDARAGIERIDLDGWTCEGQLDLTDLVETERIPGSMPPGEEEREAERARWYAGLASPTSIGSELQ